MAVEEENVKFIARLGLTQAECCERTKHREWERTKHWSQENWDEYKVRRAA